MTDTRAHLARCALDDVDTWMLRRARRDGPDEVRATPGKPRGHHDDYGRCVIAAGYERTRESITLRPLGHRPRWP